MVQNLMRKNKSVVTLTEQLTEALIFFFCLDVCDDGVTEALATELEALPSHEAIERTDLVFSDDSTQSSTEL